MSTRSLRAVRERLWPSSGISYADEVYAVLDAARDPRVYPMVQNCGAPHACLYAGAIPRELAEVAPYVVRLRPEHPFTGELLAAGWGESWGVFAAARESIDRVRQHLRRFLRVKSEDGKTMIFRYYDPRVLRVYLPTCTAEELTTFFGPLTRLMAEQDDPSVMDVYAHDARGMTTSRIELDPGGGAA